MVRNYGLPTTHHPIAITHDGTEHRGTYVVDEGWMTVRYNGHAKDAELRGLKHYPEQLAEMLLSELVREQS